MKLWEMPQMVAPRAVLKPLERSDRSLHPNKELSAVPTLIAADTGIPHGTLAVRSSLSSGCLRPEEHRVAAIDNPPNLPARRLQCRMSQPVQLCFEVRWH
jgi:hypothetical protein